MKKMAILQVTPEVIRELLHLPDGAVLTDLRVPFHMPGVLELKIEGAGWNTPEAGALCVADPCTVVRGDDGSISVDWNLPNLAIEKSDEAQLLSKDDL